MAIRISMSERLKRIESKKRIRAADVFVAAMDGEKYRVFNTLTQHEIGLFDERTFKMWLQEAEENGSIVFLDDIPG